MKYAYAISNWRKFQHYSHRNPPWIKLHFEILSSADWVALSDASRVLAIACMLIASRNDGKIPDDKGYIKRVAYLNHDPNYSQLLKSGFLIKIDCVLADASVVLTNDASESESESELELDSDTELESSCHNSVATENVFPIEVKKIAELLGNLMLDNDPKAKVNLSNWESHIEKLIRLDGRPVEEIESVVRWCQQDDFWKSNILSGASLRKKFPKLRLAMGRKGHSFRGSELHDRNKAALKEYLDGKD